MTRWIMEWLTISFIGVLGIGILVVFNTLWSIIPGQIADTGLGSLDAEGKAAILLLFVVIIGSVKLFSGRK
ncbi:MAG: hypothetical protein E4H27_04680 [Anaerolineales bacterium]|nr:MAG: hypothetical protein E4H27_04680 [Anaerolineales bacterium]